MAAVPLNPASDPQAGWDPMSTDHGCATNHPDYDNESAETVVLGLANSDASRQCHYYARGAKCPRGNGCPWEHTRPRPGGWCAVLCCVVYYGVLLRSAHLNRH